MFAHALVIGRPLRPQIIVPKDNEFKRRGFAVFKIQIIHKSNDEKQYSYITCKAYGESAIEKLQQIIKDHEIAIIQGKLINDHSVYNRPNPASIIISVFSIKSLSKLDTEDIFIPEPDIIPDPDY